MPLKNWIQTLLSLLFIFGTTTFLFFYTRGDIRIGTDEKIIDFSQTGMLGAKSIPESANIKINGVLTAATDTNIPGLEPGIYEVEVVKPGYVPWKKEIEIFPQLVTDITAVLVSETPRLEPLTNTGARVPTLAPSGERIAFFAKDPEDPGVWVIPLSGQSLNIFGTNPNLVIEDTPFETYSNGISIIWSPDETQLLIEVVATENTDINDTTVSRKYVLDIQTGTAQIVEDTEKLLNDWKKETTEKRQSVLENAELPETILQVALDEETVWAPDNKKFLYKEKLAGKTNYKVYNTETPLPVGEKVETTVLVINDTDKQPAVTWYTDSYHLVLTELDLEQIDRGTVSLIRIDGTNKTEVFNNTLMSDKVYSAPGGDKLVILTSFKSTGQSDLYTIGIR